MRRKSVRSLHAKKLDELKFLVFHCLGMTMNEVFYLPFVVPLFVPSGLEEDQQSLFEVFRLEAETQPWIQALALP